jgi:hypothetical protein
MQPKTPWVEIRRCGVDFICLGASSLRSCATAVHAEAAVAPTAAVINKNNNNNFTVAAYLPEWRYEGANFVSI